MISRRIEQSLYRVGKLMMIEELENQFQKDLIKTINGTKDGEVSVVQLPIELIATSTLY